MTYLLQIDDKTIAGKHLLGLLQLLVKSETGIKLERVKENGILTGDQSKLSLLRGHVSKMSSNAIDKQLNELRNEW